MRRRARGTGDNYRIVQDGGRWYVQHKDRLGEWWDINPDGQPTKEEAEMELEEARSMYSRRLCSSCRGRDKRAGSLKDRIEQNAQKAAEHDARAGVGPVDDPLGLMGHYDALMDMLKQEADVMGWADRHNESPLYYPVDEYYGEEVVDIWEDAYQEAHSRRSGRKGV